MTTNIQSILNYPQFQSLTTSIKLPIKTVYKISRLSKAIDQEIAFYQAKFREIAEEYCQKDENGNYVFTADGQSLQIISGKEEECNQAMIDLYSLEVELPDITFVIDEFDGMELTVNDLNGIMPFIID